MSHSRQMIWATAVCLSAGLASALRAGKGAPSREQPRILVEQHLYATGGSEALVQLLIACADAGGNCWAYGEGIAPSFEDEYKSELESHGLLGGEILSKNDVRPGDTVIVPEIRDCMPVAPGVYPYIYVLAERNLGPDACPRLSHNHHLASLPGVAVKATLTPYIAPSIKEHARELAGLQSDGTFKDLQSLIALKEEDVVLVDGDSSIALLHPLARELGSFNGIVIAADAEQGSITVMSKQIPALLAKRVGQPKRVGKRPPSSRILVTGFSKTDLLALMMKAKVVVDLCMRGTERMALEASLQGAVVITNNCQTGQDGVDFPIKKKHKIADGDMAALISAIRFASKNYASEVMDSGQVALREKYGSRLGRSSLSAEFWAFKEQIT